MVTIPIHPPSAESGLGSEPVWTTLKAGTTIYRVHATIRSATAFNPTPARDLPQLRPGGRFDVSLPPPQYLYASSTPRAALAEAVLRNVADHVDQGLFRLPRAAAQGRSISALRVQADIPLLDLRGQANILRAGITAGQTLTSCAEDRYRETRACSDYLLVRWPEACGLAYLPRHEQRDTAWVLWQDDHGDGCRSQITRHLEILWSRELLDPEWREQLDQILKSHGAAMA